MDPIYGVISGNKEDVLVEFHNGSYKVPIHPDEFHNSYHDYFSYPIGICDNPESLLLAATDCIYPFTYM